MEESERSFAKIEESDLERLALLSREDRDEFFSRQPRWQQLYANRLLCVALCQGAAVHYVEGRHGLRPIRTLTSRMKRGRRNGNSDRQLLSQLFGMTETEVYEASKKFHGR